MKKNLLLMSVGVAVTSLVGCSTRNYVVAATGTTLGVEIAQNPSSQMYEAKLGYNRGELAIVPTDRSKGYDGTVSGADQSADVLMELRYGQIFSVQNGGIYQRLAVGKNAVGRPGAALMFAKGPTGDLDADTAKAVASAVGGIDEVNASVEEKKNWIVKAKANLPAKAGFIDGKVMAAGYGDWAAFITGRPKPVTDDDVEKILKELKKDAVVKAQLDQLASE